MKTSKLQKFAWAFFALALTTTTIFAQSWRNGNSVNFTQNGTCLEQISGLSEDQKTQITGLEKSHQEVMAELRNNRRSTFDATEKNEIRGEMLEKVENHQNEVKNLLNEDQQKQYDLLHFQANNLKRKNVNNSQGNYRGRGNSSTQQFNNRNRGNYNGNGAGINQGNNRRNNNRCPANNRRGKGNNRNNRGFGNGYNSSNS